MAVHSQIRNGNPRRAGDALRSAGFGSMMDRARTARKQAILDRFRRGELTRHQAEDQIFAEKLGDA